MLEPPEGGLGALGCDLNLEFVADGGVGREGVPSLTDPLLVSPESGEGIDYLAADDRVVGVVLDGVPIAVPHNLLWHHEIVNLSRSADRVAVTHCPLTGSSLVFDRSVVNGQEFGVSGILYQNNLVMWNRTADESLWPQMYGEARCGSDRGRALPRIASMDATWEGWQALHPSTLVVSETGIDMDRDYTFNPYDRYEASPAYLYEEQMPPLDGRRPPKERVLGIPGGASGVPVAVPFGSLEEQGSWTVAEVTANGERAVVFWDGRWEAAMAYRPVVDGEELTFTAGEFGIEDVKTGTRWGVHGVAQFGPRMGDRLEPLEGAYVAYWGAWAAFHPGTEIWAGS